MTARSKVTLVEAMQIRAHVINTVVSRDYSSSYEEEVATAIDTLLALGLIDTDAALRAVNSSQVE